MKKTILYTLLALAVLAMGAALNEFTVKVDNSLVLKPDFTGFFTNNAANIRGALTNDFATTSAINTESNRINGLATITDGLGTAANEDAADLLNRANHTGAQAISTVTGLQTALDTKALATDLTAHTGNTSNPHAVTKAQVGLGSVDNYPIASQAQAQAGTDNATYMTPLRTAQAITALGGGGASSAYVSPSLAEGRLTLVSGQSVTTTNCTNTVVYYTPHRGTSISLYDGTSIWTNATFSEITMTVPTVANKNYDVFLYDGGSGVTYELVAWTDDTTRATALATQSGVYVKTGDAKRKYVGTFRTTATAGQVVLRFGGSADGGSSAQIYVWNLYNPVSANLAVYDTTDSWTYSSSTTWRSADNSTNNRVAVVFGLTSSAAATFTMTAGGSGGALAGIGVNSTTTPTGASARIPSSTSTVSARVAFSGLGYQYAQALERIITGSSSSTFSGDLLGHQEQGLFVTTQY